MIRNVLVTGCASGIGLDLTEALARGPFGVMATDVDLDALEEQASRRRWPRERVCCGALDVADPGSWESTVAEATSAVGPLDVLVNVAGIMQPGWVHDFDVELAARQLEVNIGGVVYGTRHVAPGMIERGRGQIINVASMAALAPIDGIAIYSASKYAVRGFSLAAASELRRHGIRVTVICPDAVRTPMLELQRGYEEAALTFSGWRTLEPGEVTAAILRAMHHPTLEVFLPRHRGWLARLVDVFPASTAVIGPMLRRRGRRNQSRSSRKKVATSDDDD